MKGTERPAFYCLATTHRWKDYINLLHAPYTLWHLSYVVIGAAAAPSIHVERLLGTSLAFFLALGIGAHALDELNGRPLQTAIPARTLGLLGGISIAAAVGLGIASGLLITPWIFPFVALGGFIVVAYNLGLWNNRFHSDTWFALAWGAFPVLTSYWINAEKLGIGVALLACGCFALSLAQRTLSTQVRTIRRKVLNVEGTISMDDGTVLNIDKAGMVLASERSLRLLTLTISAFALGMLALHL